MQSSWKEEFAENPFCQCLLTFVVQHPYAVIGLKIIYLEDIDRAPEQKKKVFSYHDISII